MRLIIGFIVKRNKKFSSKRKISKKSFEKIQSQNWGPVKLEEAPEWLRNMEPEKRAAVYTSGSTIPVSSPYVPGMDLVGGYDVYRKAEEKDGVLLNKDWYAVVLVDDSPELLIVGPFKDHEHWLNDIPSHLHGSIVLKIPPK